MSLSPSEAPRPYTSPSFERAAQPHLMNIMNIRLMQAGLSPIGEDLANWGGRVHTVKINHTGFELQFYLGEKNPKLYFEKNGDEFSLSIGSRPDVTPGEVRWNKDKPPQSFRIQKLLDKDRISYLIVFDEGLVALDTDGNTKYIAPENRHQIPSYLKDVFKTTS